LVVYDAPSPQALRSVLVDLFPFLQVEFPRDPPAEYALGKPGLLPVWLGGKQAEAIEATAFMREFVYPLADSAAHFVVAFPFPQAALSPRALEVATMGQLDLEDFRALLCADAIEESFSKLDLLRTRTPLTPIEEQLAVALEKRGLVARPQVRFGRFTVDFL